MAFDWQLNERLRSLSRRASLEIILAENGRTAGEAQMAELLARKNRAYLTLLEQMDASALLAGQEMAAWPASLDLGGSLHCECCLRYNSATEVFRYTAMKDALRVLRSAVVDLWNHAFLVILCSLSWLVLTLLIVPGPPATLALFDMAERIARREHLLGLRDYLSAVRERFVLGWRWGILNILVVALLLIDIVMVQRMVSASLAWFLQLFFFVALVLWIVVNWYALAFLFQQKDPSLRQALRNGAVLLLQNPVFTLVLTLITAVALGLSVALVILIMAIVLFAPMLVALISTHAVLNRLAIFRAAQ